MAALENLGIWALYIHIVSRMSTKTISQNSVTMAPPEVKSSLCRRGPNDFVLVKPNQSCTLRVLWQKQLKYRCAQYELLHDTSYLLDFVYTSSSRVVPRHRILLIVQDNDEIKHVDRSRTFITVCSHFMHFFTDFSSYFGSGEWANFKLYT